MQLRWPDKVASADLGTDEVHVWAVALDAAAATSHAWEIALTDDERARAEQIKLEAARQRFVVSRSALRTILGHHLAVEPQEVPLVYANNGKPELKAGELHFNLAHSGELALVAVTSGCPVGVDVEHVRPVRQRDELAHRYFTPAEIDAILALDELRRGEAFLNCWTRKEAVLKSIGTGLGYPLDAFAVPIGATVAAWIDIPARGSMAAARCCLMPLAPCAAYVAAVATLDEERKPVCVTYRV